jgi:hypothetical protein
MRQRVTTPARAVRPKKIGLWGATQCGKTTFLAALYIAVSRAKEDLNIIGEDDDSTEFMVSSNRTLTRAHQFPEGTDAVSSYSWIMNVTRPVQQERSRWIRPASAIGPATRQFTIALKDAPGRYFDSDPQGTAGDRLDLGNGPSGQPEGPEEIMEYLAECDGLLLLVDPVREREMGDAHEFFQGTLLRLAQRRMKAMPSAGKLPHYVAVCITKFDDPEVYKFARVNGYRTFEGDDPFPRVHSDDAEDFFRELCDTDMSDADLICQGLPRYFQRERIRYFVTSAIGFYRNGTRFLEDDAENAVEQGGEMPKIRGRIHPINVLEPVMWLGESITA